MCRSKKQKKKNSCFHFKNKTSFLQKQHIIEKIIFIYHESSINTMRILNRRLISRVIQAAVLNIGFIHHIVLLCAIVGKTIITRWHCFRYVAVLISNAAGWTVLRRCHLFDSALRMCVWYLMVL